MTSTSDASTVRSRRIARCSGCGLPEALCLCAELTRVPCAVRVVLVSHVKEASRASSTGRLVANALAGAELRVAGERQATTRQPLPAGRALLLFPTTEARELTVQDAAIPTTLLVPEGSWPQAKRLARRDPDLRLGEPVRLPSGLVSAYTLRHNEPGHVSTIEAVAAALSLLGESAAARELSRVFFAFQRRSQLVRRDGSAIAQGRLVAGRLP